MQTTAIPPANTAIDIYFDGFSISVLVKRDSIIFLLLFVRFCCFFLSISENMKHGIETFCYTLTPVNGERNTYTQDDSNDKLIKDKRYKIYVCSNEIEEKNSHQK